MPAVKKITPSMANAQGFMVTKSLPKIPGMPSTSPTTPATSNINETIFIMISSLFQTKAGRLFAAGSETEANSVL
jgi:hypothetical protein